MAPIEPLFTGQINYPTLGEIERYITSNAYLDTDSPPDPFEPGLEREVSAQEEREFLEFLAS